MQHLAAHLEPVAGPRIAQVAGAIGGDNFHPQVVEFKRVVGHENQFNNERKGFQSATVSRAQSAPVYAGLPGKPAGTEPMNTSKSRAGIGRANR